MKKVLIILMSTLALAAVSAGSAMAACPVTGCGGTGGTGTSTQTFDLTVAAPSRGTITGTSINCGAAGSDCTSSLTYTYNCIEYECTRTPEADQVLTLAWSGPAGFGATWSGCETVTAGQCNVLMDADRDASAAVADVADPTVAITGPADEVGNSVVLSATAADNDGVKRVDFFVDGALKGSDTVPPYQYNDTTSYAHGENHTATARAVDHSDRTSALSAGRAFSVDRQVNLALGSTPPQGAYTNAASPSLGFSTDDDVAAGGKLCRVAGVGVFASCASPFAPALGEGPVALEVKVTDNVGNTKTLARGFTVDRTVPAAAFTDGPGEGAEVSTTSVEISFEASDTSPLARACKVDGGGFGACSSATSHALSGLAVGSHSLTVRVTDAAGNVKTITRSFAVKAPPTGTSTSTSTNTGTGPTGVPRARRRAGRSTPRSTRSGGSSARRRRWGR